PNKHNSINDDSNKLSEEISEETIQFIQAYYYIGIIHYENKDYEKALHYFNQSKNIGELTGESLFYKAACLINLDKLEEAQEILNLSLNYFEDRETTLTIAGLLSLINNKREEARNYLRKVHSINPNSNYLPYYFSILNRMENNLTEAEKYLNKEYRNRRNDPKLLYELALLQIEKNNYVEATQYLKMCIEKEPDNYMTYHTLGIISMEAQNHDTAKRYFDKALMLKPNEKSLQYYSAINEYKLQNYETAYKLFQSILPKSEKSEEYEILYYIGMCKYKLTDIIAAREFFGQSIQNNNKFYDSLYMYAKTCFELSIPDEGYKYYKQAAEINPGSYDLFMEWALRLVEDKLYDEALNILDRAKASNKNKVEPYLQAAQIYEKRDEKDKSVSEYANIIKLSNNNYDIMIKYAKTLTHIEDYSEAVKIYKKAFKLREPQSELLIEFTRILIKDKKYREAEEYLTKLLRKHNIGQEAEYREIYKLMGIAKTNLEKYKEAVECFEKAEELREISPEMISCWAYCLYKNADYKKAVEKYNLLIEISEKAPHKEGMSSYELSNEDLFYAGESASALEKYNLACSYYSEILMKESDYTKVYIPFATALIKSGNTEEAYEVLEMAEQSDPHNFELFMYWGKTFLEQKMYKEALEKFNKASIMNNNNPNPHLYKAQIYKAQEKLEEAEKEYRKALLINPNHLDCMIGLGDILVSKHNYEEATGILKHALYIDKNNVQIMLNLAYSYHKLGQFGYADNYYSNIYEIRPDSVEVNLNYANLLFDIEKYKEAKNKYEIVIKKDNSNAEALMKLGIINYINGNIEEAQKLLIRAKKKGEDSALLLEYTGKIEFELKNYKDSYPYLKEALEVYQSTNEINDEIKYQNKIENLYEKLGENAFITGNTEEANNYYEKLITLKKDKDNTKIIKKWINYLLDKENYERAYEVISKVEITPKSQDSISSSNQDSNKENLNKELCRLKGIILYKIGQSEKALPYLLSGLSDTLKFNLNETATENNHEIIEEINTAVTIASIYIELDMLEDASNILKPYINNYPDNFDLLLLCSQIERKQGNIDRAFIYSEKLISINPSSYKANIEYGECFVEKDDLKKAIIYY
ncbi:MAG: tetratricopeptide repeat protein, partial [Spirochaetota bacterium]